MRTRFEQIARASSGTGGPGSWGALAICLAVAPLLAMPIVRPADGAEPCAPVVGEIVSVEGAVELSRAARPDFERAALGDLLCVGDAVRTGPLSRAAVALVNEAVLRLDERTELTLRVTEPRERTLLEMVFGAVYLFSHRPRSLAIDTPFVNAGGEGTEFFVRVDADQSLLVVYDGRVVARNDRGELGLGSGDAAVATATTPPSPRTIVRPRDLVAWAVYYPPILPPLARGGPRALPEAFAAAGRAVAEGDYPRALARLDEVPEAARDARYFIYRAGVLLGVGRVEAANAAIERALALDLDAGDAFAQRSIIEVARNDVAAALADSERAVALAPTSSAAWIARSYALQARTRIDDARAALLEAADVAPEDALVFARLAEIELARGDLDAALEAAERAVALEPDLARTQMVLGYAELVRIDTEDALEAFERAILLDQANPLPHLGRGLAIIRDGDLEAGRRELEIAVALDPEDAVIRSYLGKAFFEERRDELAAEQLRIAKRLDPNDPTPWFYNAIRLQLENRPVEALRDLETAIDLNDNRAVYRSSFLLDQDLATRSVSLARIYDDLGFDQLAVTEASRSLSRDPSNWSAHRFLSDAYARLPRHEIARASELLQAQLLQPININPVQPSAQVFDLNLVQGVGPPSPGFNEFHSLFERNQPQLTGTGIAGTNDTFADEVIASAIYDRYSVSAGQFYSSTDGFRPNNELQNQLYNAFAQTAVTPNLNLQTEFRHRSTQQGDLQLNFDPNDFFPNAREDIRQNTFRLGGRYQSLRPGTFLLSGVYTDFSEDVRRPSFFGFSSESQEDGALLEGQHILESEQWSLVSGLGYYELDSDFEVGFDDFGPIHESFDVQHGNAYSYATLKPQTNIGWTLGLSIDRYQEQNFEQRQINPKFGISWQVWPGVQMRIGVFRTLTRARTLNQTIEPTTVAGFNQLFDDFSGTDARRYAAGVDLKLLPTLWAGIEYGWRDLEGPIFVVNGSNEIAEQEEETGQFYVAWTPTDRLSFRTGLEYERFEQLADENTLAAGQEVRSWIVPLELSWFDPSGVFAEMATIFVNQNVDFEFAPAGEDSFVTTDLQVGYRLPRRRGVVSIEATNLFDERFQYQDVNFRTSETINPRFIPERIVLGRVSLTF